MSELAACEGRSCRCHASSRAVSTRSRCLRRLGHRPACDRAAICVGQRSPPALAARGVRSTEAHRELMTSQNGRRTGTSSGFSLRHHSSRWRVTGYRSRHRPRATRWGGSSPHAKCTQSEARPRSRAASDRGTQTALGNRARDRTPARRTAAEASRIGTVVVDLRRRQPTAL